MQFTLKNRPYSLYAFFVISICVLISFSFFVNWGTLHHPFKNDINQYYSYLNALFIEHDLYFKSNINDYWLMETPTHHFVPKVTYGMAFFYCPFFIIAKFLFQGNPTGYEPIFAWSVHFGCIVYILIGLYYTRKNLLIWFDEKIAAIAVLLLFFGTNLFYYTVSESESVHGVLFFLISFFLFHVIKWHQTASNKSFLLASLCAGFICLIRPTECIVLIIPLLIGVNSKTTFINKLKQIALLKWTLVFGILLFLMPLVPQLLYWKIQSGSFLFFSYGSSEGFFWTDPQIINVFFSYRKGFFIYTPMMLFAMFGFIIMYKKQSPLFYCSLIYFLINSYLICTWWDWSFGGSFGMRSFIHCFAILVVPFAYFVNWVLSMYKASVIKKGFVYFMTVLSMFFCLLNVWQSNLYKHNIIHWDGMTKEAYQFTFFKRTYSEQDFVYLKTLIKSPDYESRRKGERND